jgi:hypothetical protein
MPKMTKLLHHFVVAVAGSGLLLAPLLFRPSPAFAQPSPPPAPVMEPESGPATVVAPPEAPNVPPPPTVPTITAPAMTRPRRAAGKPLPPTVDDGEHGPKSPSSATGYAVAGVFAGPVLLGLAATSGSAGLAVVSAVGFWTGPSMGRWYVGEYGGGPLLVRGLGIGLMIGGLVNNLCGGCRFSTAEEIAFYTGLGLYLGSTIYDLATASDRARAYNLRHRKAVGAKLTFAPMLQRSEGYDGRTATTTGLMLGGSF